MYEIHKKEIIWLNFLLSHEKNQKNKIKLKQLLRIEKENLSKLFEEKIKIGQIIHEQTRIGSNRNFHHKMY